MSLFWILVILTCPAWIPLVACLLLAIWFGIFWLFGVRITITKQNKEIGYIRWFTFHRMG